MVVLQVLGAVLVAVGLVLFIKDQMDDKPGDTHATTSLWKINLSGPPALVLTLLGVLIFVFPFTGFFRNPIDPNPPPPTVPSTTVPGDVGTVETTLIETGTTLVAELPPTPTGWDLYEDSVDCAGQDVLIWYQDDYSIIWGWWVSVVTYSPHDESGESFSTFEIDTFQQEDDLILGNYSGLCYQDFTDPEFYLDYDLWVYSYNESGYSLDPLFITYSDLDLSEVNT